MTPHPNLDVLADAAEGLLDAGAAARVQAHLAGCSRCRDEAAGLAEVTHVLSAVPPPPLPPGLTARLNEVLAQEQARRERSGALHAVPSEQTWSPGTDQPYGTPSGPHPALRRHFASELHAVPVRRRFALPALAAALAAAVVGTGGYVLSATLGQNEPPAVSVSVASTKLGTQARDLLAARDLSPHYFSQAWWCARRATDRPVAGLVATTDAGRPALLVYGRTSAGLGVTVVSGCDTDDPVAGPWTPVPG